jgi:hypothetical protein
MLTLDRKLRTAAFAALGMLIGAASTPAGAYILPNGISTNGIHVQALTATGMIASGSALGDLNGVAVEAITLPQALEY